MLATFCYELWIEKSIAGIGICNAIEFILIIAISCLLNLINCVTNVISVSLSKHPQCEPHQRQNQGQLTTQWNQKLSQCLFFIDDCDLLAEVAKDLNTGAAPFVFSFVGAIIIKIEYLLCTVNVACLVELELVLFLLVVNF